MNIFGGIWSSDAAAYALRKTVVDNLDADPLVKNTILNFMYVDDLTESVESESEVHKTIVGVPAVLHTGGFELSKFVINNEKLMAEIPKSLRAKEVHEFSHESIGRALGIKWHIHNDAFMFCIKELPLKQVSRRSMLSFTSATHVLTCPTSGSSA